MFYEVSVTLMEKKEVKKQGHVAEKKKEMGEFSLVKICCRT